MKIKFLRFAKCVCLIALLLGIVQGTRAQTLTATINQKSTQPDPTNIVPVAFTVVFSAPINVSTFTAAQVLLSGTATGKAVTAITEVAPMDHTTFEVSVTATGIGTVIANIPPGTVYGSATFPFNGSPFDLPTHVVVDASGNMYANSYANGYIYKITPSGTVSKLAANPNSPYSIAIDAAANLYVPNIDNNTVNKITTTPTVVMTDLTATTNTGIAPSDIVLDKLGNLYTLNNTGNNVTKIVLSTGVVTKIFVAVGNNPTAITVDASNNLFVLNGNNSVTKITPAGVKYAYSPAVTGAGGFGITTDPAGNVYVSNNKINTITKIAPSTGNPNVGVATLFATTQTGPSGITTDKYGNVFVDCYQDSGPVISLVYKYSPAGDSTFVGTPGTSPQGMFVADNGTVYTANALGNSISRFGPSVNGIQTPGGIYNQYATYTDNQVTLAGILPITLASFTGTENGCTATLNWLTVTELNSSYYAVEASLSGSIFAQVAKVASRNSATGAAYAYNYALGSGTTFFRLKAVDNDGKFTYSPVVAVTGTGACSTGVSVRVSPNPTKDVVNIQGLTTGSTVTLYGVNGQKMTSVIATGTNQAINISMFAKGVYILRILATDGSVSNVKVIKN